MFKAKRMFGLDSPHAFSAKSVDAIPVSDSKPSNICGGYDLTKTVRGSYTGKQVPKYIRWAEFGRVTESQSEGVKGKPIYRHVNQHWYYLDDTGQIYIYA